jgi:multiple sugar transport system permease protein
MDHGLMDARVKPAHDESKAVAQVPMAEEAVPASTRAVSRRRAVRRFKWSILAPLIALVVGVLLPVLFLQLYFSFHQWTVYLGSWWEAEFVGLDLFRDVLTDPRFGWAVVRSLVFATGSTLGCFVIGFALAYLMHRPFRGQALYYVAFILPMLTVPVVVAYTAEMLLYQSGPINDLITRISGITFKPAWLTDPAIALPTVMLLEIWNWTPFSFIIMLAGLSSIPREPLEAAEILGASKVRIFWEVQLPLLRPVIFLALVLRFLEAMAEFPKTWALLQGGPGTATETLPVLIFLTTWQYFDVSKGAAMSYIVMLMMIAIVLVAIRLLRREKRALDAMYGGAADAREATA